MRFQSFTLSALAVTAVALISGCGGSTGGGQAGNGPYQVMVVNQEVRLVGPEGSYVTYDSDTDTYSYHADKNTAPVAFNQPGVTPRGILTNDRLYWFEGNMIKVWGVSGQVANIETPAGHVPIAFQSDGRAFTRDPSDDNKVYRVLNGFPTLLGKPREGANLHESQYTVPVHRPVVNTTDGSDNVVMIHDGPNWRQVGENFVALNTDASNRIFGVTTGTNLPTVFFDTFNRATYALLEGTTGGYALAAPGNNAIVGICFGGDTGAIPTAWRGGQPTEIEVEELTSEYTYSHHYASEESVTLIYTHNISGDPLSVVITP